MSRITNRVSEELASFIGINEDDSYEVAHQLKALGMIGNMPSPSAVKGVSQEPLQARTCSMSIPVPDGKINEILKKIRSHGGKTCTGHNAYGYDADKSASTIHACFDPSGARRFEAWYNGQDFKHSGRSLFIVAEATLEDGREVLAVIGTDPIVSETVQEQLCLMLNESGSTESLESTDEGAVLVPVDGASAEDVAGVIESILDLADAAVDEAKKASKDEDDDEDDDEDEKPSRFAKFKKKSKKGEKDDEKKNDKEEKSAKKGKKPFKLFFKKGKGGKKDESCGMPGSPAIGQKSKGRNTKIGEKPRAVSLVTGESFAEQFAKDVQKAGGILMPNTDVLENTHDGSDKHKPLMKWSDKYRSGSPKFGLSHLTGHPQGLHIGAIFRTKKGEHPSASAGRANAFRSHTIKAHGISPKYVSKVFAHGKDHAFIVRSHTSTRSLDSLNRHADARPAIKPPKPTKPAKKQNSSVEYMPALARFLNERRRAKAGAAAEDAKETPPSEKKSRTLLKKEENTVVRWQGYKMSGKGKTVAEAKKSMPKGYKLKSPVRKDGKRSTKTEIRRWGKVVKDESTAARWQGYQMFKKKSAKKDV